MNNIPNDLIDLVKQGIELYPAYRNTGQPIRRYTQVEGIKTIEELEMAWSKGFTRFVFVPSRVGLIALECDVKNGRDWYKSLSSHCIENGYSVEDILKDVPFTTTPSNGCHHYFCYNSYDVVNNEILSGVEIKHSMLITAPGSISDKGYYTLGGVCQLLDAPPLPLIIQNLLIPKQRNGSKNFQAILCDITLDKIDCILRLQGHTPSVGNRNKFVYKFSLFGAKCGIDQASVTVFLLKYSSPDFPESEIKNAVKSAYRIRRGML